MNSKRIIHTLILCILVAGCSLEDSPECAPGQFTCDKSASQLVSCGYQAGLWADRLVCPDSCNDKGTTCAQVADTCDYSGSRCVASNNHEQQISMTCHEGTLFPKICLNGCDHTTGKCVSDAACTENDKKCFELDDSNHSIIQSECHNGSWLNKYCDDGMSCNGDSCKCTEGSVICKDGSVEGKELTCIDGKWGADSKSCNGLSCDGDHCGVCKNGDKRCADDPETHIGKLETCVSGKWSEAKACENQASCGSDIACGQCMNTEVKCVDDETTGIGSLYTCNYGKWTITPCEHVKCNQDGLSCGPCTKGKTKCSNHTGDSGRSQVSDCSDDGSWTPVRLCDENISCNGDMTDCGECGDGEIRCVHDEQMKGTLQSCTGGVWQVRDYCGGNSCNEDFTGCGTCKNEVIKKCENEGSTGKLTKCINGAYQTSDCPDGNSCNASKSDCGECINGIKTCEDTVKSRYAGNGYMEFYLLGTTSECIDGSIQITECDEVSCGENGCGSCLYSTNFIEKTGDKTAKWCSNALSKNMGIVELECSQKLNPVNCSCGNGQAKVVGPGFSPYFVCLNGYLTGKMKPKSE